MKSLTKENSAKWLKAALQHAKATRKLTLVQIAELMQTETGEPWEQPTISKITGMGRELKMHEALAFSRILDYPPPGQKPINIVGKVGAGAVVYGLDDGPYGDVENDHDYPEGTLSVEVEGNSMGAAIPDGSLIFFDQTYECPQDWHIRHNCIVWLADGRVLVKHLRHGSADNLWPLVSLNDFSIEEDVVIEKVAKVTGVKYP